MTNKSFFFLFFLALGIATLFQSCANIHALNGGEKDVYPPKDSIYSPLNFGINFKDNAFSIKFDEYIKLNDINNQLIVSPPLKHKPKVTVKKKTVYITFEDTLIPNTTYIFNFGEGIVDYTEGNAAENLSYVFSTGSELDSLSIKGKCVDAFTNQPLDGIKVMLYQQDVDSLPLTTKPFYFAVTNKAGEFSVPYMKPGDYKVFGLQDDNGNYLYEEEEKMGFLPELISASETDSTQQSATISMSIAEPSIQTIVDQKSDSTGFVSLKFTKKPKALSFEVLDLRNPQILTESTSDSSYFWIKSSDEKDKIFKLVVKDEEEILDTLYLLYFPKEKTKIDWIPQKSSTAIAADSSFVIETYHTYINSLDKSKFILKQDSLEIPVTPILSKSSNRKLEIQGNFEEGKKYELMLLPEAVFTLNDIKNDTVKYQFRTNTNSIYGSIKIMLNIPDSTTNHYFAQLTNKNNDIFYQRKLTNNTIYIPRLEAKKYTLRLIKDANNNQQWDPGNYSQKTQPEKCIYFPETIQVKPNWVLEYEWEITFD